MFKKIRPVISLLLLAVVLATAVYYCIRHRSLLEQLGHTPLHVTFEVFALYVIMFGVLLLILSATLRICGLKIGWRENSTLNAHTLFINFFMPGQGGPAYRGVYLNRKYKLTAKNYIVVTLLYYVFYGIVSVLLMLGGSRPWWQTLPAVVLCTGGGVLAFRLYSRRFHVQEGALRFSPENVSLLFLATTAQAVIQMLIYAVELHSVQHHIALAQVASYTGTANLALFVALTPGAIGIRESFLLFTRQLHHIGSTTIILANIIDRSVYISFLLILTAMTIAAHLHGRIRGTKHLPALLREQADPEALASQDDRRNSSS